MREPSGRDRALATLLPVFDRLRAVIEAENQELSRGAVVDYPGHSQRKNQVLLELSRMRTSLASACADPAVSSALTDLSAKLDLNRRLLGCQLRAARTVASIVSRAIREGQSDGTYSAHPWRDER